MTFAEKLRQIRTESGITLDELAEGTTISRRSIASYEKGDIMPRSSDVYASLSEFFDTPIEFWTSENDDDADKCAEYAQKTKDKREIDKVISDIQGLFAGGRLSEDDAEKVMQAMKEAYWELKMGNPADNR